MAGVRLSVVLQQIAADLTTAGFTRAPVLPGRLGMTARGSTHKTFALGVAEVDFAGHRDGRRAESTVPLAILLSLKGDAQVASYEAALDLVEDALDGLALKHTEGFHVRYSRATLATITPEGSWLRAAVTLRIDHLFRST